jgi:hypothetical protein
MTKRAAYEFLSALQQTLEAKLPTPDIIRKMVEDIKNKPVNTRTEIEKLACGENNVFYLALPFIFDQVKAASGFDDTAARKSILCEYHSKFPQYSSGNSFRSRQGHPFGKNIKADVSDILKYWRNPYNPSFPANQAYPELCLRSPFMFRTIFEGKYFKAGSVAAAEQALVTGVWEVAYYRGLPWNYEYGCLLAYDASPDASLKETWASVGAKRLFWEDANVFVMVVRGENADVQSVSLSN